MFDDELRGIGRQAAGHTLADVRVDHAALFDCAHKGGEAVVEQDDLGRLLRHVGPRQPHRDTDACVPKRGGVVDAVARDGHDMTGSLDEVDDARLVRRVHPAEDRAAGQRVREHVLVAHGAELLFGDDGQAVVVVESCLPRDGFRGAGEVSGDDVHLDARIERSAHRIGHLIPNRIDHRDEAQQHQIPFDSLRIGGSHILGRSRPRGVGQVAEAAIGLPDVDSEKRLSVSIRDGPNRSTVVDMTGRGDDRLGCSFHVGGERAIG